MHLKHLFSRFTRFVSYCAGHPGAFVSAVAVLVIWGISGPFLGFSDTWQLVINTATTIITFLMVFVIQSSQNRDTEAIQIKLDELIHVTRKANNKLLAIEELDADELAEIKARYAKSARETRNSDDSRSSGLSRETSSEPIS